MIEICYFDLDGVLADFERGVFQATGKHIPTNMGPDGFEESGLKSEVFENDKFFIDLPLMIGAKEMSNEAKNLFPSIQILSAYGSINTKSVQSQKHKWVKRWFGNLPVTLVPNSKAKGKFGKPTTLLIDDRTKATNAFKSNGGNIILHTDYRKTIKEMGKFT